MDFPPAIPEIPVSNIKRAAEYYVKKLGFTFGWANDEAGIAGISRGSCRMYLTNEEFRESSGCRAPVVSWLNLESKEEVDDLYRQWREAGAVIVASPVDKPWHLREFTAADADGNRLRVFYDFSGD